MATLNIQIRSNDEFLAERKKIYITQIEIGNMECMVCKMHNKRRTSCDQINENIENNLKKRKNKIAMVI